MPIAIITDINKKIVKNIRGKDIYCCKIKLTNWFEWVLVQKKDNNISVWQQIEYRENKDEKRIIEPINRHDRHIVNAIVWKEKKLSKRQLRWKKELNERTFRNIITLVGWIIRITIFMNLLYIFVMDEFILWIISQEYTYIWKWINILLLILIAIFLLKNLIASEYILDTEELYDDHYEDKFLKEFE